MHIEILNPLEYPGWDKLVLQYPDYTFFHSLAWARVLSDAYGYKPLYFSAIENGKPTSHIPVMEINSFLTGKRGVSLPFTDHCSPLIQADKDIRHHIDEVIQYGRQARWKYIEWRGGETFFQGINPSYSYWEHTLDLVNDEKQIFSTFRDSTKRNIKKAVREGVEVRVSDSLKSVKQFYLLNCMTRKTHGLPPQPCSFFRKIYEHVISKRKGFVLLSYYQKTNIAGAIFFQFGDKALFKYGASDKEYHRFRANNLIMWEAIKGYAGNGCKSLSLGRTDPDNLGLLQFKRGWGTRQKPINYYRYDCKKRGFVSGAGKLKTEYAFFKKLPAPMLKLAGSLLYSHIG